MESNTSKAEPKSARRVTTLDAFVADIDRRRSETGITDLPRNSGKRRTGSKRVLLKSIKKAGANW